MATLREIKETGWRITVHCETIMADRVCVHYTEPSIDQLIQYLGADFDLTLDRAAFLSRFRCEKCGGRNATVRIVPPFGDGLMAGAGNAHSYTPTITAEERAARAAAFEAEFRRKGLKTNAEQAKEARARLKALALAEKGKGDLFIGPPNPYAHRKRGRWL